VTTKYTRSYATHEQHRRGLLGWENLVVVYTERGGEEVLPARWTLTGWGGRLWAGRRIKRRLHGAAPRVEVHGDG